MRLSPGRVPSSRLVKTGQPDCTDCPDCANSRDSQRCSTRTSHSQQPAVGEPVHVVFLGRIGERKGTFRLLDAWADLASDPDFGAGGARRQS